MTSVAGPRQAPDPEVPDGERGASGDDGAGPATDDVEDEPDAVAPGAEVEDPGDDVDAEDVPGPAPGQDTGGVPDGVPGG